MHTHTHTRIHTQYTHTHLQIEDMKEGSICLMEPLLKEQQIPGSRSKPHQEVWLLLLCSHKLSSPNLWRLSERAAAWESPERRGEERGGEERRGEERRGDTNQDCRKENRKERKALKWKGKKRRKGEKRRVSVAVWKPGIIQWTLSST